jgi:hypothetical protein
MGRRLLRVVAIAACVVLLGPIAADGSGSSGVRGKLRLSHGCPGPVREGDTRRCDFAGAGILIRAFRTSTGPAVAANRTDRNGHFVIALRKGRYLLRAEVTTKDQPQLVRVRTGSWTVVTLRYLIPPYME